nr:MAG TPA: hypothetical protein [Caudoviricetes sp.]
MYTPSYTFFLLIFIKVVTFLPAWDLQYFYLIVVPI